MSDTLSRRAAILLFALVIFSWGITWPVTKAIVAQVPPLWASTIRSAIAGVALLALLLARGNLIVPKRGDIAVVLNISLLHMVAFAALVAIGLQFITAGRSVVLGYTAPLWVVPGAWLFLGERLTARRAAGVGIGVAGLALMFNPLAFDWRDSNAVLGNGLILLGALCWAVSILHVRAHTWISTPFQLVFWEILLATVVLLVLALLVEGPPPPHRLEPGARRAVPVRQHIRRGGRLLGHGHGQPQPACGDDLARHPGDAGGGHAGLRHRARRAHRHDPADRHGADPRRHRRRHDRRCGDRRAVPLDGEG